MKVQKPTFIKKFRVWLNKDFAINRIDSVSVAPSLYKGKMMIYDLKERPSNDLSNSYGRHNSFVFPTSEPFLYVAPECSLSRDALRNSGYKIVRDWDKSSLIVLPDIKVFYETTFDCMMEEKDSGATYLIDIVNKKDLEYNGDDFSDLLQNFKKSFDCRIGDSTVVCVGNKFESKRLFTINKCDMYEQIYSNDPIRHAFCFESDVRISPTLEINPELFAVWRKCKDRDVVQCAVMQVDWQKYPTTLAWFLVNYCNYVHIGANAYLKKILEDTGYFELREKRILSREVDPEDWNMLQKCELYSLGISEQGGFVNNGVTIPDCLRSKIVVKPQYIDEPHNFNDLMQAARI